MRKAKLIIVTAADILHFGSLLKKNAYRYICVERAVLV